MKSVLDSMGEFFFKKNYVGGDMSEWGDKKISEGGDLLRMMPWKCGYKFIEDNHVLEIYKAS